MKQTNITPHHPLRLRYPTWLVTINDPDAIPALKGLTPRAQCQWLLDQWTTDAGDPCPHRGGEVWYTTDPTTHRPRIHVVLTFSARGGCYFSTVRNTYPFRAHICRLLKYTVTPGAIFLTGGVR